MGKVNRQQPNKRTRTGVRAPSNTVTDCRALSKHRELSCCDVGTVDCEIGTWQVSNMTLCTGCRSKLLSWVCSSSQSTWEHEWLCIRHRLYVGLQLVLVGEQKLIGDLQPATSRTHLRSRQAGVRGDAAVCVAVCLVALQQPRNLPLHSPLRRQCCRR